MDENARKDNLALASKAVWRKGYQIVVTEFERSVVLSLLESALDGWEGNQDRQDAALRVIRKLREA